VYLPADVPAPTVVTRTPYGRHLLAGHGRGWTRRGFAYVAQDVRGRYDSGGDWNPYRGEHNDGRVLIDWVAGQPWCNGAVIAAGASYGSFTAWAAALETPSRVRAVISEVPAAGLRPANVEASGLLRLREYVGWWDAHGVGNRSREDTTISGTPVDLAALPVRAIGRRLPGWWSAITDADAAHTVSIARLAATALPSLHIGGFYDLFLPQTLEQWEAVGRDRDPRPPRGLVIGPWRHELSTPDSSTAGGHDHGPVSQQRLGPLQARWITDVLAGREPSLTQVFLVGAGRWLAEWPPPVTTMVWFARPDGHLTTTLDTRIGRHPFDYDPRDPMPTLAASADRSVLDHRPDQIAFRSAPLPGPMTLAGVPVLHLRGSATAPRADWIVRLVHRHDDGRALELTEGNAADVDTDRVTIRMRPLAVRLPAGAIVELTVTGSDFPRLARNLNADVDRYTGTRTRVATQTVISGGPDGTSVHLPVRRTVAQELP
jgi:putative CocE/NonD family hydrolase